MTTSKSNEANSSSDRKIVPPAAPLAVRLAATIPWTSSMIVHAAILIVLALWVLPVLLEKPKPARTVWLGQQTTAIVIDDLELLETDVVVSNRFDEVSTPFEVDETPDAPDVPFLDEFQENEFSAGNVPADLDLSPFDSPGEERGGAGKGAGIRRADNVENAVDALIDDLRNKRAQGDVQIMWLLDASISLREDRRRIAARLETLLQQINATLKPRQKTDAADDAPPAHTLRHSAFSYGKNVTQLAKPSARGNRIPERIRSMPSDPSGQENVMSAVGKVVGRYAKKFPGQTMIVIWTDESGDDFHSSTRERDYARLEETITRCLRLNVTVSVVGPSAVLGLPKGLHPTAEKHTGQIYYRPIDRGPDAARIERVLLPYWWFASQAGSGSGSGTDGLPAWYGGNHLIAILSGSPPYGLARLATATQGTYTLFDRSRDATPFDIKRMRRYLPDYGRSLAEIENDLKDQPLRQAVLAAVGVINGSPVFRRANEFFSATGQLETVFHCQRYYLNPYYPSSDYQSPASFRRQLAAKLADQIRKATITDLVLARSLKALGNAQELELQYEQEKSLRARGWYDLTRGRLLAFRLRLTEYRLLCQKYQPNNLKADTNFIKFVPSPRLRSGDRGQVIATEARRLLERCVENNKGTPWEFLAKRELEHPFGIAVEQHIIPKPKPIVIPRGPRLPLPPLPPPPAFDKL